MGKIFKLDASKGLGKLRQRPSLPCVHCLFMFYFYKKREWLFWFCAHRHQSMRSIAQSIDRTVIDPCICIECKLRS